MKLLKELFFESHITKYCKYENTVLGSSFVINATRAITSYIERNIEVR